MKLFCSGVSWVLIAVAACFLAAPKAIGATVVNGVSEELAKQRKQYIDNIIYDLELDIPAGKTDTVKGREQLSFRWKKNEDSLQIDFKTASENNIRLLRVNGVPVKVVYRNEHIIISPEYLAEGKNLVRIEFISGGSGLKRKDDFVYTLFVPANSRETYPCFDQPDLKAVFKLDLTVPTQWSAVSNAPLSDSLIKSNTKTYRFGLSDKMSTYLFAFAAGNFQKQTRMMEGRKVNFYYKERDSAKIKLSMNPAFQIQDTALWFMEKYTKRNFPFRKYDFVAIPQFEFGGMEHVGNVFYKEAMLFLNKDATQTEENQRIQTLAHEVAHMWFGDLVTMQWFNDVWLKEVFANFMADKVSELYPGRDFNTVFITAHYPAAYNVDRTEGAHPIRQKLDNLNDAGLLYGGIIYDKAPIMMRQLELLIGKEALKASLQQYIQQYAFGNATWDDLFAIIQKHSKDNLTYWENVWLNKGGRPVFDYNLKAEKGRVKTLQISQKGEQDTSLFWPQSFTVDFVYRDHIEPVVVRMKEKSIVVKEAEGKQVPLYLLFNTTGEGYGLFPVDRQVYEKGINIPQPAKRAYTIVNLFEMMLTGKQISPKQLLQVYEQQIAKEKEDVILDLLNNYTVQIYWRLLNEQNRQEVTDGLETVLWKTMMAEKTKGKKNSLFKTYAKIAMSKNALDTLYEIWKTKTRPDGTQLTEDDQINISRELAVRDYRTDEILNAQLNRIKDTSKQKVYRFIMPALSSNISARDRFFEGLAIDSNRKDEPAVQVALMYLHHPLRQSSSIKYLPASLQMMDTIKKTGAIFFPGNWMTATFSSYQSHQAADILRKFFSEPHPELGDKLIGKMKQTADMVYRAEQLTGG